LSCGALAFGGIDCCTIEPLGEHNDRRLDALRQGGPTLDHRSQHDLSLTLMDEIEGCLLRASRKKRVQMPLQDFAKAVIPR
jgi:hypothetical protein